MVKVVQVPYEPRDVHMPFHTREQRWAVVVAHRRAGKTVATINDIVSQALYTDKENARYAYIAPFYSQAKQIAWDYLKYFTRDVASKTSESGLNVELFNGARVTLYGADNPDALRGIYLDGLVLDEYGDCKPNLWTEVLRATLADRKGWATFIGTPKGLNHFYDVWELARANPNFWYTTRIKASESGILDPGELAEMKATMSEEEYEQEMECSFQAPRRGAYFAKEIVAMEEDGRLGTYPLDLRRETHYAFDLGRKDSTAVWGFQNLERVRFHTFFEEEGRDAGYFCDWLWHQKMRGIHVGNIWLPHDAKQEHFATGKSTKSVFLERGFIPRIIPKFSINEGIRIVRRVLKYSEIDAQECKEGILALRSYRREFNEERKVFIEKPVHDWSSNPADAMRYACTVAEKIREEEAPPPPEEMYARTLHYGFTLEELWEDRGNANTSRW